MNTTHLSFSLSLTLVCLVAAAGCVTPDTEGPEPDANAPQDLAGGYGYEFHVDRLGAVPMPAVQTPAEVSGRLAPELALDVLRSSHGALQACQRAAIASGEAPQGEATLEIWIGAGGGVLQAKTAALPPAMSTCVAQVLGALHFPRSTEGHLKVVYPLLLGSGS